jgi:hypothetical protein
MLNAFSLSLSLSLSLKAKDKMKHAPQVKTGKKLVKL